MANKARLSFCTITNDGDDEGALRLHEPPTARQARDPRGPRHPQAAGDLRVNAGRLRAFAFGRSTRGEATLGAETGSTV